MNPYENLNNPALIGQSFTNAFERGREMRREEDARNAMAKYATNPNDPAAFEALAQANPQAAINARQQQAEAHLKALEGQRDQIKLGAQIIAAIKPQDQAGWDRALQMAQQAGIDITQVPREFNPEYAQGMVAIDQQLNPDAQNRAPSSVQEYEYARGQGYNGSYMDFSEARRGPMIANNGDGTFTIIPRGAGGQAPPPPPAGFVIDNDGGPTPPASGGFPR